MKKWKTKNTGPGCGKKRVGDKKELKNWREKDGDMQEKNEDI